MSNLKIPVVDIRNIVLLLTFLTFSPTAQAYEVWLGCTKIPRVAVTHPELWEHARSGITGTNVNLQGFVKKNLDNPVVKGEENLTKRDWRKFFAAMRPEATKGMRPIARSSIKNRYAPEHMTLEEKLENIFSKKNLSYGYTIGSLLPYSSRLREDKQYDTLNFSTEELIAIRKWLDTYNRGQFKDVKIVDNIRLFRKSSFLNELPSRENIIDSYLFEAAPEKFYKDAGNRQEMLRTFIEEPSLKNKDIIFQIPISPWNYEDEPGATNYQMLRNFIVWLGDNYGYDFLKGDRVKFLITTYDPTIPFYPELSPNGREYQNTISGIILSLIEQEPLLSGSLKNPDGTQRIPTKADAYSNKRHP